MAHPLGPTALLRSGLSGQDHRMPNAIKMLQDDNNSLRMLLCQVQLIPAGQADAEDKAARQLASMLRTHSVLEDEFITPLLTKFEPDLATESDSEHDEVKRLLGRIESLRGLERRHVMIELQEVVRGHKHAQEISVFPLFTKKLSLDELERLGHAMSIRQQVLLQEGVDVTSAAETGGHRVSPLL